MIASIEKIEYGKETIEFELIQEDRKTFSIEVLPTTKIKVKAPKKKNKIDILNKVLKKAKWIIKQKQYFVDNYKKPYKKRYISGESFIYLGKQYRLKVMKSSKDSVTLKNGYLMVESCLKTPEELVENWYENKARQIYEKKLDKCFKEFSSNDLNRPLLKIRKLKKRWGSYNKEKNIITMNVETVKASINCIEYVIFHELCHSKHFSHNKAFYELLETKCKNWKSLKFKLEQLNIC
ncbi:MAG: M48 family metallopeptidase [Candidatus Gastranaerophilales bacterium]|nr:M48 family metallopeptidase [Candidatus Gastranaerophilales bacterium]